VKGLLVQIMNEGEEGANVLNVTKANLHQTDATDCFAGSFATT
jgi:hypothetical protein